jgi:hypothetical protein
MAYAVVGDHMGSLAWSETFDDMSSAVKCYTEWAHDRGKPESSQDHYTAYFEYGAHGERVSIVMEPSLLQEKLASCSSVWWFDDIIWKHTVRRIKETVPCKKANMTTTPSKKSRRRWLLRQKNKQPN